LFNAPVADQYPVFICRNAEVLGLFGWEQSDRKYFSFAEFTPFLRQIDEQGAQSDKLGGQRSAYQSAILNLRTGWRCINAKEQHSARGHAKFCRGAAELRKCSWRSESGAQAGERREF
jgi:hypothetical protein